MHQFLYKIDQNDIEFIRLSTQGLKFGYCILLTINTLNGHAKLTIYW